MAPSDHELQPEQAAPQRFATTHWSLVVAARERDSPHARDALAALCRQYWYPLYAFIRHQGHGADQAQDLTQEFFVRILEKDYLAVVDREKGRFRAFLMAACKHFLANQRDYARARKRGGRPLLSLDFVTAEHRYNREPSHRITPERLFERRWVLTMLDQVLARLREELNAAGKERLFHHLKGVLAGEKPAARLGEIATRLGMSEGAVKVAVHRLRHRYRELLREEIAQTVGDAEQIEEEIRILFTALGS